MVQATIPQEVGKITGIGRRSKLLVESGDKELILMKKNRDRSIIIRSVRIIDSIKFH